MPPTDVTPRLDRVLHLVSTKMANTETATPTREDAAKVARLAARPARSGVGPLLQRDYWALIDGCRAKPSQIIATLFHRFHEFAPPEQVTFRNLSDGPLRVGDDVEVQIRGVGAVHVRVAHQDAQSLTLITLEGHPEAGRITFGAYRNDVGDVIFHIRSRARSSSHSNYLGFLLVGNPMQTLTWTDFVNAVAVTFGNGVRGFVHADTTPIEDEPEDQDGRPTFIARGD